MYLIFKVGNKYPIGHKLHYSSWRDGQLVEILPDTAKIGPWERKHFAVIQVPGDMDELRGTSDIKSTNDKALEFNSILRVKDSFGRLPWDAFYNGKEGKARKRDYFVDYKTLLNTKLVSVSTFDSLYDKTVAHETISIESDFTKLLQIEEDKPRLITEFSDRAGTIATGTYSIGDGLDYNTIALFEADIAATLTGDLTGEHADEETVITGAVQFQVDTATYDLKLTAASGAKHNGTYGSAVHAAGDGARVNYGTYDSLRTNLATLLSFELSDLVLNVAGTSNAGFYYTAGEGITVQRMVIKGDANTDDGIDIHIGTYGPISIINNIIYDISAGGGLRFVRPNTTSGDYYLIYNNTIISCDKGIQNDANASTYMANSIIKNNLVQNSTTSDYSDAGGGYGTHAKNLSEDATSPDTTYRSKDLHTNSVFKGYATDDFRLDSGGDATNLAIVDDGDDLSGTFTDDIEGQTRDTWYIGASEIVSAGVTGNPWYYYAQQQ